RRCAVAHVERLTPRVKHDLTLSGRSPNPTLGPSSRRHRFAAAVLDLEALRRLAGAYYSVTQILRDARNTIPGASAVCPQPLLEPVRTGHELLCQAIPALQCQLLHAIGRQFLDAGSA